MTVIYTPAPPPKPKAAVPRTPAERAAALLDVADTLTGLLRDEDAALGQGRLRQLGSTVATKQKLAFAFEELCRLLRVDQAGLAGLDADTKVQLRQAVVGLRGLVSGQADRLRTRTEAHRSLVESLVRVFRVEQHATNHYANGLGLTPPPRSGEVQSAAFNVRI